jgi:anti-anti-sigma regulatory factor
MRGAGMHVRIRNKIAILEFENGVDKIVHNDIMEEVMHLVEHGFKDFIFDFKHLEINFNSTIAGFLIVTVKKLTECGSDIRIQNISKEDYNTLQLIGIDQISDKVRYAFRNLQSKD